MHGYEEMSSSGPKVGVEVTGVKGGDIAHLDGVGACVFSIAPESQPRTKSSPREMLTNLDGKKEFVQGFGVFNVLHMSSAPLNVISWSALKVQKPDLQLAERTDGSLIVRDQATKRTVFRFEMKNGVYVLVKDQVCLTTDMMKSYQK